uniref:Uncharacterized protein n=1 Tax=Oryza sativa subsp. japonica TaxID=39947 RepID=Q5VPU6_ORYSJ|nr:hypothetical protein [Oryza sativa Japonica Group]
MAHPPNPSAHVNSSVSMRSSLGTADENQFLEMALRLSEFGQVDENGIPWLSIKAVITNQKEELRWNSSSSLPDGIRQSSRKAKGGIQFPHDAASCGELREWLEDEGGSGLWNPGKMRHGSGTVTNGGMGERMHEANISDEEKDRI